MTPRSGPLGRQPVCRVMLAVIAVIAALVAALNAADAQRTTEQFIPIGQSPGLSDVVTYMGEIVAVDPGARSLTLRRPGDAATVTATIAGDTRIWLDRSSIGRPNLSGAIADLAPGSAAEIHFRDPEQRRFADWIKVRSERPD